MRQSITCYDLPVLLGRGFKFGVTDEVLWGRCREGKDWQAYIDGEFITFALKVGQVTESHRRMSRVEFDERFAA